MREELEKEIEDTFSPIFRMIERNQVMIYRLIELLVSKGVITKSDYEENLSSKAIDARMDEVNEALAKEGA